MTPTEIPEEIIVPQIPQTVDKDRKVEIANRVIQRRLQEQQSNQVIQAAPAVSLLSSPVSPEPLNEVAETTDSALKVVKSITPVQDNTMEYSDELEP